MTDNTLVTVPNKIGYLMNKISRYKMMLDQSGKDGNERTIRYPLSKAIFDLYFDIRNDFPDFMNDVGKIIGEQKLSEAQRKRLQELDTDIGSLHQYSSK